MRNLSVNALQCTSDKHRVEVWGDVAAGPIQASADERFIATESFQNTGPLLALSVEDTGPGISPENMAKLFAESFTTQEKGKGTGLGLFIVQRLVGRAKGAIHVRTKVGQGTTFTIYLPLPQGSK